jgi:hypothetical protein
MNIDTGNTPLVLLCPAWKNWGTATKLKVNSVILHSRADGIGAHERDGWEIENRSQQANRVGPGPSGDFRQGGACHPPNCRYASQVGMLSRLLPRIIGSRSAA